MLLNPIINNVWQCGDIKFTIADDFSKITIEENNQTVILEGQDIVDLYSLMHINFNNESDDRIRIQMAQNMGRTTRSFPITKL